MKRIILSVFLAFFLLQLSMACTAFCLSMEDRALLAKNLDWPIDDGLILVNRSGVRKSSFSMTDSTFSWTSLYSSITFNQFGRELPLGGMNEEGLVVEELNMPAVPATMNQAKHTLNEFQVVQYMLDNFRSLDEIEAGMTDFQILPLLLSLHYLIMDRKGNSMIMEYNGSRFNFYRPAENGIAILSNNPYRESIRYLKNFRGFGGDLEIQHRPGSNERFVSVAGMLSECNREAPLRSSFEILDTVSQPDTRWSIVYDATALTIHLKFHDCPGTGEINLRQVLSLDRNSQLGADVDDCTLTFPDSWRAISPWENEELIKDVVRQLEREMDTVHCKELIERLLSYGRQNRQELVDQLNEVIAPLPEASPAEYDDRFLEDLIAWEDYSLIGLGEGTHGTLDFFELKQRIFRFLAEHHQCRTLAYEYSFRKSLLVNDYIHHRYACLDSLFKGDLWIQDNETVRQFISWMRDFNEGREEKDQISFIGIDNQLDAMMIDEVLGQLASCLPGMDVDRDLFPCNVAGKKELSYEEMNEVEYEEIKQAIMELKEQVQGHALALRDSQDVSKAGVALQLVNSLLGSHDFLYLSYAGGKNIRDRQLAENVLRILPEETGAGPVAVWAHNAHVACNPHYTADGSPAMGWYLRDSLRGSYLSVATSFSLGQFTAVMLDPEGKDTPPMTCQILEAPPQESLNSLFHQAGYPQFYLNIRALDPDGLLYRFFNCERPMIGVGDLYLGSPELHFTDDRILNLLQAHDLLFYYRDTRPLL